jgi:hypothetical protein
MCLEISINSPKHKLKIRCIPYVLMINLFTLSQRKMSYMSGEITKMASFSSTTVKKLFVSPTQVPSPPPKMCRFEVINAFMWIHKEKSTLRIIMKSNQSYLHQRSKSISLSLLIPSHIFSLLLDNCILWGRIS